ncbi:MAG: hypothetical protein IPG80_16840 [Anaerolineales bacterium]|jgi:hypothetical protein|uniref:hypothetical protein n=1 Tax=Candidatus Villigracilis vicinus TaxID=3140679 RepID=UPI003135E98D|nr:hypothetical protein [Anaerolineales bacterium]MBK9782407.1 hypothetical protein [Anaerolineales bacterium]
MSLLKPNAKTPFHIDFEWWKQNEGDWHIFLRSFLCAEHQEAFANVEEGDLIDWVDPRTAEVKPVDGVQHALMTHCAQLPEFVDQRTAVVEAIFRMFLANGNIPMSSEELSKKLGKPADTILRTIAGPRVYRGLRPILSLQPTEPA